MSTPIIAGLLSVEIDGYNLGASLSDVTITVGGHLCTSVVHVSPQRITCMIVLTEPSLLYRTLGSQRTRTPPYVSTISELTNEADLAISIVPFSPTDVQLTTPAGTTTGVMAKPLTVVRSGSGRPTMSHIVLTVLPFAPQTLTVVTHNVTDTVSKAVSQVQTLYWSNVAYGAYTIQRSRIDGSQVETVVTNVSVFFTTWAEYS